MCYFPMQDWRLFTRSITNIKQSLVQLKSDVDHRDIQWFFPKHVENVLAQFLQHRAFRFVLVSFQTMSLTPPKL